MSMIDGTEALEKQMKNAATTQIKAPAANAASQSGFSSKMSSSRMGLLLS